MMFQSGIVGFARGFRPLSQIRTTCRIRAHIYATRMLVALAQRTDAIDNAVLPRATAFSRKA